jgi:hypothetical protein
MEQLREQDEIEEERQSAEVADLEDQMDEEWSKYRQQLDAVKRRLEAKATEVGGWAGVAVGGVCFNSCR